MMKPYLLVTMLLLACAASAQIVLPNAGSMLQQLQPALPVFPAPLPPRLVLEPANAPTIEAVTVQPLPVLVKRIRISGNRAFDTLTLHALVADAEGRSLTPAELGVQAARIADYYHAHGYGAAQANAHGIGDGVILIEVSEDP